MFLTSFNLAPVTHGFFTRNGGVSTGLYASLNCGTGSGDRRQDVLTNRERVASALGAAPARLMTLHQIHSSRVVTVTEPWDLDQRPEADAMVTSLPGLALGVLAADCVPVLFADRETGVIGAAHSGWKGTLSGVLQNTVAGMCALGASRGGIAAAIGPAIGQTSYEVGGEFREAFLAADGAHERSFTHSAQAGHFLFDIKGLVADILQREGLESINTLENDTYIEETDFFSFRRATHRKEPDYGRQLSAIMLTTGS